MSTQPESVAPAIAPETSLPRLVEAASRGSSSAFDELVRRFQDMALATAFGWLQDPQQAEDAAQEAFVEVYRNLDRLEEPAAFPGFLRRIVLKHCDRRTRRPQREGSMPAAEPGAGGPATDLRLSAAEDRARVRAALEELPPAERLAVALHYLAGLTQPEVATWLELPLSTVKKRLHSARGRLRDAMETMMQETFEAMRPSRSSQFSDTIRLFLAIREGDVAGVAELVARDPGLLEAEERWEDEITRTHGLPVPNGGTPLVRAAERNQVEMIELLLERGAEIDRACPCAGGESPLWAAVANGQLEAARCLLGRGADPNPSSFAEHTPLHVAALRGFDEIARALCDHGADGLLRDRHGRTPADWASLKGHTTLARDLRDRFDQRAPGASAPEATSADSSPGWVETGIKALDLFAPIGPGSRVQVRYDPGQGGMVLLGELTTRWARRQLGDAGEARPATIWVGWERQLSDLGEVEHAFAELDLASHTQLVWSPAGDDEEARRSTMARAASAARELQDQGVETPLVVVFGQRGRLAEIESGLPALVDPTGGAAPVTVVVAERYGDAKLAATPLSPLSPPFDARIAFDSGLVAIGHLPAIHPLATVSSRLVPEVAGERHCRVAAAAREALASHRELVPDLGDGDPDAMSEPERLATARARRLQAYLTQPFLVTESFTGKLGEEVELGDTLSDVEAILNGACDEVPLGKLPYRGRLGSAA